LSVLKREVKEETDLDIKSIGNSVFRYSDTENKFEIYFYEVKSQGEYQSSRAKQTEFGMNLS
jgi:8-oxo-dGTP pyrophosphatase MutT (NUDIX family)